MGKAVRVGDRVYSPPYKVTGILHGFDDDGEPIIRVDKKYHGSCPCWYMTFPCPKRKDRRKYLYSYTVRKVKNG